MALPARWRRTTRCGRHEPSRLSPHETVESRRGRQIRHLAGDDQRQRDVDYRRQNRCGSASRNNSRFSAGTPLEIVRKSPARRGDHRLAAGAAMLRRSRPRRCRQRVNRVADQYQLDERRSRCISFGGRSGGGTSISGESSRATKRTRTRPDTSASRRVRDENTSLRLAPRSTSSC